MRKRYSVLFLTAFLILSFCSVSNAEIKFTNNATSLVADVGGISDVDTTVNVTTGDGALFPVLAAPNYFMATLVDSSGNREIVKVTARSTDTLTIVRAQEGTSARAFAAGSVISHRLTAGVLEEFAGSVVQGRYCLSNYASFAAAVTAIGGTIAELILDADSTLSGVVNSPSTLSLRPVAGFKITTAGNALSIAGPILGDPSSQWLSGANVSYSGVTAFKASWIASTALASAAIDGNNVVLIIDRDDTGSGDVDLSAYDIKSIEVTLTVAGANRLILPAGHPYKTSWRGNLDDTITDIGDTETSLEIDCDVSLSGDVVIPSTVNESVSDGSIITLDGHSLTGLKNPNPKIFGPNTIPGTTDMTAEIQACLDGVAYGGVIEFEGENYLISTGLTKTGTTAQKFSMIGKGPSTTVIETNSAITMLTLTGGSTSALKPDIFINGIQFDGNSAATRGLDLKWLHYSTFKNCKVLYVNGEGLYIDDSEDLKFIDFDVRRCGDYANQKPATYLYYAGSGAYINTIWFDNCTFEANYYTGFYADTTEGLHINGCKFHGRTTDDDTPPNAVDLLQITGTDRVEVTGCQFSQVRLWGIHLLNDAATTALGAKIINNSFKGSADYTDALGAGEFGYIYVQGGGPLITANEFEAADSTDDSYDNYHVDIKIAATADGAEGFNTHYGAPQGGIAAGKIIDLIGNAGINGWDGNNKILVRQFNYTRAATTDDIIQTWVDGDTLNRMTLETTGLMKYGDGTTLDTSWGRGAAGRMSMTQASAGHGQQLNILMKETELTAMSGATATWTSAIPAGSIVLGCSARVTTLITSGDGSTTFDLGPAGDADGYGNDIVFTKDTTVSLSNGAATALVVYPSATNIVVTANAGTFSAGAIRLVLYYITLTAPTS